MRPWPIPESLAFLADGPVTSVFDTRVSSGRHSPDALLPGLPFLIGFEWPPESAAPVPIIRLDQEDCSLYAALTMEEGDRLVIDINLSEIMDIVCRSKPGMYLKAQAVIDSDGRHFNGGVASTCSDMAGDKPYLWKGSVHSGTALDRRILEAAAWRISWIANRQREEGV
ncbi:hypothetical protein ACFFK0_28125 [Paenibacillus chartarius]|uniref:Uncharacterized protein n=1 Tax=Paenibacillus chartarius TaxID=747481 RepID=A0ABV6DUD4_9BACL